MALTEHYYTKLKKGISIKFTIVRSMENLCLKMQVIMNSFLINTTNIYLLYYQRVLIG